MRFHIVSQGGAQGLSLAAAVKPYALQEQYDRLDVAVAYATSQGVRALSNVLEGWPPVSRWVVGMDDAITQPVAIDELMGIAGADVRIAKLSPNRRFHPKLYRLWASERPDRSVLLIGSGNMTERGLQENAEAGVILEAETQPEVLLGAECFNEFWNLGHTPTTAELDDYRTIHAEAEAARRAIVARGSSPPAPGPTVPVGPSIARDVTPERVIAVAVARIAAKNANGVCSLDEGKRLIPLMLPLTSDDLSPSNSQPNTKWVQRLRNIQSNSRRGGPGSTNFIRRGLLEHVDGGGYRVTPAGRAMLAGLGY